jgi:hypothetical protein
MIDSMNKNVNKNNILYTANLIFVYKFYLII